MPRSPSSPAAPLAELLEPSPSMVGSRWSLCCIAAAQPQWLAIAVHLLVDDLRRCDEVLYDDARVALAVGPIAAVGLCALGNRRGRATWDGAIVNSALALALHMVVLLATSAASAWLLTPRCAEFGRVTWFDLVGPIDLIAVPIGVAIVAAIGRARPAVTTPAELLRFCIVGGISVVLAASITTLIASDRQSWAALISCC